VNENPQPLSGNQMPRFGGIATFMRLPGNTPPADLDVAVVGVPLDTGTSNRPGARFGPRGIRDESVLLRPYNMATRAAPFDSLRIDDTGDVAASPYDLLAAVEAIEEHFDGLLADDVITASMGGDHTVVLPILRAMAKKHGPVGLVHIDAHTDINDTMFGSKVAHGTPFRRAVEEGLLAGDRVGMVGYFCPLVERMLEKGVEVLVVEKKPERVELVEGLELAGDASELARCDQVLCTASTLINDSLEDILRHSRGCRRFSLIGPSGSGLPDPLFKRGVESVGGIDFFDLDALHEALEQQVSWGHAGHKYQLTPEAYPGVGELLHRARSQP